VADYRVFFPRFIFILWNKIHFYHGISYWWFILVFIKSLFKSTAVNVPSGVPQGRSYFSLIFSLFVNRMNNAVQNCISLMIPDDLKLFLKIESESDRVSLKNVLDPLSFSFSSLGLQFNTSKWQSVCFVVRTLKEFKLSRSLKLLIALLSGLYYNMLLCSVTHLQ